VANHRRWRKSEERRWLDWSAPCLERRSLPRAAVDRTADPVVPTATSALRSAIPASRAGVRVTDLHQGRRRRAPARPGRTGVAAHRPAPTHLRPRPPRTLRQGDGSRKEARQKPPPANLGPDAAHGAGSAGRHPRPRQPRPERPPHRAPSGQAKRDRSGLGRTGAAAHRPAPTHLRPRPPRTSDEATELATGAAEAATSGASRTSGTAQQRTACGSYGDGAPP
jgi:hypothetical protein